MQVVEYKGDTYPYFQTIGNASQFAIPFAKYVCSGSGYDIGCMKQEWAFPGATPIDLDFDDPWHADNLPPSLVDYIFSSHCLEHVPDWVETMNYWYECIKPGGTLFLYLPDYSQKYWRPWNNRRHKHCFKPDRVCERIVHQCARDIFSNESNNRASASQMSRFFFLIGEVAVDLLLHTEELSVKAKKLRLKAQETREARREDAKRNGEEDSGIWAKN